MLFLIVIIVLSYFGSLPFGMINLNVLYTELKSGRKASISMALGAAMIELVQGVVAAIIFTELLEWSTYEWILHRAAAAIFIGISIFYFFKKKKRPEIDSFNKSAQAPFIKGLFLSSVNFLAIPFWLTILALISDHFEVNSSLSDWILFGLGAGMGGFLASCTYARIGSRLIDRSSNLYEKLDYIMGSIFLVLGILAFFM